MKTFNILSVIVLILMAFGCNKTDVPVNSNELTGKWKLVGQDWGLPDGYVEVKNGYELVFHVDGTFQKQKYNDCRNGNYRLTDSSIIFDYDCATKSTMLSEGVQEEYYSLSNGLLQLTPSYLNCAEGCSDSYKKIAD
ncbi:hypothetical protein [Sphingobacterium paludis]|uniref:Lipocalin-like protein n=1 Tax=Sphingobacterium paludis TaxID=1476465 RepID=A0A4R7D3I3_9SPHI|nr:hypothetical protein [Sphingobacterium paludis]TDS14691.1 hypothetical protein B0I21_103186 [Sphingobacterium paludis]